MKTVLTLLVMVVALRCVAQNFEGLKEINGTKLFVSVRGEGKPLVVLHGGPGLNHSYFRPHLDPLEDNFQLIYFDQRACGKSATPSPDSISIKFLVEDLEALRNHLKLDKLDLLAHSWGAVLAIQYAIAYPENTSSIIFSNPSLLSREYDQEAAALIKQKTTKADSANRAEIIQSGNLNTSKYNELMRLSFKASAYEPKNMSIVRLNLPENFVQANRALFTGLMKDPRAQDNLYDSLKKFSFPALIIHGRADAIPPASLKRFQTNLSKSEFVQLDKSGHFPFVEEPKKFMSVITMFLK